MRLIGHLPDEASARTFGNYLYVRGIENQVEAQPPEGWGVWIMEEDHLSKASDMLEAFRSNPADSRYVAEARAAGSLRAQEEKRQAAYEKRVRDRRYLFRPAGSYGAGPVTLVLIAFSVLVYLLQQSEEFHKITSALFISEYYRVGLLPPEVLHGQVWRLITPIFVHAGIMHILLNMYWLFDLGSMVEARQSSWRLVLLVVVIAAVSNLAQYLVSGPNFCGMSGVVFGLLGYVWIRGKFDPASGLFVHPSTVLMMLIWFVICLTFLRSTIANTVHAAGLFVGMAWGYLSSLRYR